MLKDLKVIKVLKVLPVLKGRVETKVTWVDQELKDPEVQTVVPKVIEEDKVLHQKVILDLKVIKVSKVIEELLGQEVTHMW